MYKMSNVFCGAQANVNLASGSNGSARRCPDRRSCADSQCFAKKTGQIFSVERDCCCGSTRGGDVFAISIDESMSGANGIVWCFQDTNATVGGFVFADAVASEYPGYVAKNGDIVLVGNTCVVKRVGGSWVRVQAIIP